MIYAAFRLRIQTVIFPAYTNIYSTIICTSFFYLQMSWNMITIHFLCSVFIFKCLFKLHNINKSLPKNYIYFIQQTEKNVALERKSITNNNSIASRLYMFNVSLFQYCYMMIIFTTCGVLLNNNQNNIILWEFVLLFKEGIISSRKEEEIS